MSHTLRESRGLLYSLIVFRLFVGYKLLLPERNFDEEGMA